MSNIVDWEYYDSLYSKIDSTEFVKYEALAENEVKLVIGKLRWDTITADTYGYDVLKDCICKVMDKLYEDGLTAKGKGITSVSNDGYTETYATTTPGEYFKEMSTSIRAWLSGTGLVGAY